MLLFVFRLYIDGQNLMLPKPLVVSEINPRHVRDAEKGIETSNKAQLDFEHVMLVQQVIQLYQIPINL